MFLSLTVLIFETSNINYSCLFSNVIHEILELLCWPISHVQCICKYYIEKYGQVPLKLASEISNSLDL